MPECNEVYPRELHKEVISYFSFLELLLTILRSVNHPEGKGVGRTGLLSSGPLNELWLSMGISLLLLSPLGVSWRLFVLSEYTSPTPPPPATLARALYCRDDLYLSNIQSTPTRCYGPTALERTGSLHYDPLNNLGL